MILVKLNEANFEYDIYSLIKAFYPREDIAIATEFPEADQQEEISFRLVIEYSDNRISLEADDYSDSIHTDYSDRKESKNQLKLLLYKYLKQKTGQELPWGTLTGIRPTKIPLGMLENGSDSQAIYDFMYDTYSISQTKAELAYGVAQREYGILQDISERMGYHSMGADLSQLCQDSYSLYSGIPFCPSTCLYCSFTSYPVGLWKDRMDDYLTGLEREIDFVAENLQDKKLTTIYMGGGTPTSLSADQLDRLFTKLETSLDMSKLLEFTVEAGRPDSITRDKLEAMKKHGISRISINPQTMNQKTLKLIGRHHTVDQIYDCYAMAREVGFDNINMDLILGLPGETAEDVAYTFAQMEELKPDNLTVHSLALKRSARLNIEWDKYQDCLMENSEEYMRLAHETAERLGMKPYYLYRQKNMAGNLENIGFAMDGKAGLYNIWIMEEKQTIIALGAGTACKYVSDGGRTVTRSENVKDVELYLQRLDEMIDRKREKLEEMAWL